ncbi:hypothetical protein RSAG8_03580, partial [Rhizoctonia solani AG-8 WAC10335]
MSDHGRNRSVALALEQSWRSTKLKVERPVRQRAVAHIS